MIALRLVLCLPLLLAAVAVTAAETALLDGGVNAFDKAWAGGSTKALVDAPSQDGKALQLVVPVVPDKSWMSQIWTTPLKAGVAVGDTLRITLSARCTAPADQHGQISVGIGLNTAPWTQVVQEKIEPGAEWKDFTITGVAKTALTAEQARFGFAYGYQIQSIEVAKITVVNLGPK